MKLHEIHRELRAYFHKTPSYTTISISNTIENYNNKETDDGRITFFVILRDGTHVNIESKTVEGLRARLKAFLTGGSTNVRELEVSPEEERRPEP